MKVEQKNWLYYDVSLGKMQQNVTGYTNFAPCPVETENKYKISYDVKKTCFLYRIFGWNRTQNIDNPPSILTTP